MGNKTPEEKKIFDNYEKFYNSREEVIIFLEVMLKGCLMLATKQYRMEQNKNEENREQHELKYSCTNKFRQIVRSLY